MDAVFKALSDPTRRALLDALRRQDGQTLTELEAGMGMTRFGVMKHLGVLEESRLVVTRKAGRFKYHYLNAAPIQEVADRWIAPYAKPLVRLAMDMKSALEGSIVNDRPTFVLETYIKTTPERLWDALTNGKITPLYYFGTALKSDLKPGAPFRYYQPDGSIMLDGEVVEIEPLKRIVSTFVPQWEDNRSATRVEFEIEQLGELCKFVITHHEIDKTSSGVTSGWSQIASSLKSLLETGAPLSYPPASI